MTEKYKPLFNRTYLKGVVWVIAIAIVILTAANNRNTDYIDIARIESFPVYFVEQSDAPYLQIDMLYRSEAALSGQQKAMQQLLLHVIQPQLEAKQNAALFRALEARLSGRLEDDRLVITLTLPERNSDRTRELAERVGDLISSLSEYPFNSDLEPVWNRLEAKQYLAQRDPENRLLEAFLSRLDRNDSVHPLQRFSDYYRSRMSQTALTVTLRGPGSRAAAELIAGQMPDYEADSHLMVSRYQPDSWELAPQGDKHYRLTGVLLEGRQQQNFAAELIAVRTLQQLLQEQQAGIRLIWKSLDKQGYIAMIQHDSTMAGLKALEARIESIPDRLTDELIERVRDSMLARYNDQMASTEAQLAQLDNIAFYRLPLDHLATFEGRINRVDVDQVRARIQNYLNPDKQYRILLPAF